jgi:hypothetical protein
MNNLANLIVPLGITTYVLVLLAVCSGLLHWNFKLHRGLAVTAAVLATCHAALVILVH